MTHSALRQPLKHSTEHNRMTYVHAALESPPVSGNTKLPLRTDGFLASSQASALQRFGTLLQQVPQRHSKHLQLSYHQTPFNMKDRCYRWRASPSQTTTLTRHDAHRYRKISFQTNSRPQTSVKQMYSGYTCCRWLQQKLQVKKREQPADRLTWKNITGIIGSF